MERDVRGERLFYSSCYGRREITIFISFSFISLFHLWGHEASASVLSDPLQFSCPCVCVWCIRSLSMKFLVRSWRWRFMTKTQTRMISWAGTYARGPLMRPNFIVYHCVSSVCRLFLWREPLSKHQNQWFYWTLSSISPYRTTLDLGVVKKSIVVDDVSSWQSSQSHLVQYMQCSHLCMAAAVSTVVHFERHRVRTGSFQAGVVVPAVQHWPPGAGLSHSAHIFSTLHSVLSLTFRSFSPDPEEKQKHYEQSWWSTVFSYLGRVCGQGWGTSCESFFFLPCPHSFSSRCCFLCLWLSWATALNSTSLLILKTIALAPSPSVPCGG